MALSHRMSVCGLQVIFLINIAQAFVLLTANMEDVKKLAKRFVSESLAEQIADFISNVSNTAVNLSEENEQSQLNQVSGENLDKKSLRDGPVQNKGDSKVKQSYKIAPISTERTVYNNNQPKDSRKPKLRPLAAAHDSNVMKFEPTTQTTHRLKKHHPSTQKQRTDFPKFDFEAKISDIMMAVRENRNINHKLQNKYVIDQAESTQGYAEIHGFDRHHHSDLKEFDKDKIGKSKYVGRHHKINPTDADTVRDSGYNVDRAGLKLTSRKAKIEFDQYDNLKYPKSHLVATSGHVALPKVQPSGWWDKNDYESMNPKEEREKHLKKQLTWF